MKIEIVYFYLLILWLSALLSRLPATLLISTIIFVFPAFLYVFCVDLSYEGALQT